QSAIALTGEARLALGAEGAPPLDGIPDVRPVLARCGAEGSVLEGAELARLIPALEAGPRIHAWARAIQPVAPGVAAVSERLPRLTGLHDRLRRALEDDGSLSDAASPRLRSLRQQVRDRRRRIVADLERLLGDDRLFADRFVTIRHG